MPQPQLQPVYRTSVGANKPSTYDTSQGVDGNWRQIFQGGAGTEHDEGNPFYAIATSPAPDMRRVMLSGDEQGR